MIAGDRAWPQAPVPSVFRKGVFQYGRFGKENFGGGARCGHGASVHRLRGRRERGGKRGLHCPPRRPAGRTRRSTTSCRRRSRRMRTSMRAAFTAIITAATCCLRIRTFCSGSYRKADERPHGARVDRALSGAGDAAPFGKAEIAGFFAAPCPGVSRTNAFLTR